MNKTKRELQLEKIEQTEKRLMARKQNIKNIIRNDKRKQETRMKILLGSYVLKRASNTPKAQGRVKEMVSSFSERDQKVFEPLFESWSDQ